MSPLRRWQRELGATLDDTKEVALNTRRERRTPLEDDLILSIFREQKQQIAALESRIATLEQLLADSECTVCHTLFLTPDESNEHTEATGHACRRTR